MRLGLLLGSCLLAAAPASAETVWIGQVFIKGQNKGCPGNNIGFNATARVGFPDAQGEDTAVSFFQAGGLGIGMALSGGKIGTSFQEVETSIVNLGVRSPVPPLQMRFISHEVSGR